MADHSTKIDERLGQLRAALHELDTDDGVAYAQGETRTGCSEVACH